MKKANSIILYLTIVICISPLLSCQTKNQSQTVNLSVKSGKPYEHFNEGLKYENASEPEKAIEEYKKSIEAGILDETGVYQRIAELNLRLKRYDEAEIYFRKIIEKDPKDARAHWFLADLLVWNLGKYQEGLKVSIIGKELDSSYQSYVRDKTTGRAYEGLGDYENAIKHYKIYLNGLSSIPESTDFKETKKKIEELETINKN